MCSGRPKCVFAVGGKSAETAINHRHHHSHHSPSNVIAVIEENWFWQRPAVLVNSNFALLLSVHVLQCALSHHHHHYSCLALTAEAFWRRLDTALYQQQQHLLACITAITTTARAGQFPEKRRSDPSFSSIDCGHLSPQAQVPALTSSHSSALICSLSALCPASAHTVRP